MQIAQTMTKAVARQYVGSAAKALANDGDTASALTSLKRVISQHSGPIAGSAQGFRQSVNSWSLLHGDVRASVLGRMRAIESDFRPNFAAPASKGSTVVIDAARSIGYRTLCLDTLERMREARSLYRRLGFAPSPPYYDNPLPDVEYYSLALR